MGRRAPGVFTARWRGVLAPLVVLSVSLASLATAAGPAGAATPAAPAKSATSASSGATARSNDPQSQDGEAPLGPTPSAGAALREGNRLFRRGDLSGAVDAYRRADPEALASDPVLAYNLATALHRLGRLPEAVLWYRRAERLLGTDPWLTENLERARAALAAPRLGPPPLLGPLLLHPWLLPGAAAVAAWAALFLQVARSRGARRRPGRAPGGAGPGRGGIAPAALLVTGALLWVLHLALPVVGPRPAVLLAPCGATLPAGSEVWARPRSEGTAGAGDGPRRLWTVQGPRGPIACGGDSVAPL